MINTREGNVYRIACTSLGVGINCSLPKMRIPDCMGNGTSIDRIFDPLLKVTLPCDMEQVARCPQEDDCQMTEVRGKNLLVKTFFSHAIMAFKVVRCSDRIPDPTGCRVLCECLAKFGEFRCHIDYDFSVLISQERHNALGRMPT